MAPGRRGWIVFTRYFSVEEANACIPELEKILGQLQAILKEMEQKLWSLREAKERARKQGRPVDASTFMQEEAELDFLKIAAQGHIARIREMGAILQDIASGLVDFPMKLDGQDVMLCWRLGEPEVSYFHGLTEGFAGRKPLPPGLAGPGRGREGREGPDPDGPGDTTRH